MNEIFITKMIQAKMLEKEALKSILPESMISHFAVIEDELMAMVKEFAKDAAEKAVVGYAKATKIYKEAKEEQETDKGQFTDENKQNKVKNVKVNNIKVNNTNVNKTKVKTKVSSITIE